MTSLQPRAGVHYPRSAGEFRSWFGTDSDCLDYLDWLRWPHWGYSDVGEVLEVAGDVDASMSAPGDVVYAVWGHRSEAVLPAERLVDVGRLISQVVPVADAAAAFKLLDERPAAALQVVLDFRDRSGSYGGMAKGVA